MSTAGGGGTCPAGFTRVTDEYCIETNPHGTDTVENAMLACKVINSHVCGFQEMIQANGVSGLTGTSTGEMAADFWVWSGVDSHAFYMITISTRAITNVALSYNPYQYRCCVNL
ncbi:MAG: hypothetical protein NTY20_00420 [Candidatus Aenigmarchaeota archaeon]|nr:hypothetical protein [Candidatus Aenigmarchaeota archaeon]